MTDSPRSPHHFNPPDGADLNEAFRGHLQRLWDQLLPEITESQFCSTALVAAGVAAGLLSYGELSMAPYILAHFPDRTLRGFCMSTSRRGFAALMPLPITLRDTSRWIDGTAEAEAVRSWFARHQSQLRWHPLAGVFVLTESEGLNP